MRVREKTRTNSQIFKRRKKHEQKTEMRWHHENTLTVNNENSSSNEKTVSAAPHSRSNRKTRIVRLLIEVPLYGAFQSDQFKQR